MDHLCYNPSFDLQNFEMWKQKFLRHLRGIDPNLWYIILNDNVSKYDEKNLKILNDKIISCFHHICLTRNIHIF